MKHRLEHRFPTDVARYWQTLLFDDEYQKELHELLHLRVEFKHTTLRGEGDEHEVRREIHLLPQRDAPAALDKLLRGATLVKEFDCYVPKTQRMHTKIELPVVGSLVNFAIDYECTDIALDAFTRVAEIECDVSIPVVGGKIEDYLLEEMEQSLNTAASFTIDWHNKHVVT